MNPEFPLSPIMLLFTAALIEHKASMGRWLGKSDGYALDKSDGLAASEGREGKK